ELANLAAAQAWQGAVHLELGDWQEAYGYTSEAISSLNTVGDVIDEYPPQDVYWLHYQVLTSSQSSQYEKVKEGEIWHTLDRAHELVFANIASLSDAGLRRNHLNKITINRQILLEWNREAINQGIEIETTELRSGNLQEQFKRLLAIGLRMNERREVDSLLDFIMDQLVELTGAERSLLVDVDDARERQVLSWRGFSQLEMTNILKETAKVLDEVTRQERPLLKRDVIEEYMSEEISPQGLSVMSAPLFAGGRLRGVIYVDNHTLFEPFDQTDLDLLAAFANQAASALENAQLYQGLEQRVKERTADLQQRNAELAVINSVQQGLAAELDVQAIYDLVGDQIRDIFDAQTVIIVTYNLAAELLNFQYMIEKGERQINEPLPLNKLHRH
ncbi:MAG: GAF domain-containing protein, partial [Anaerolineales bacterium]|nr:GAF domain-containing protein [Anaerolineales bacterium]